MDSPRDQLEDQSALTDLPKLQAHNPSFELKQGVAEDNLVNLQHELEDAQKRNIELAAVIEELSIERDCLKRKIFEVEGIVTEREEGFLRRINGGLREKEFLEVEIYEGLREREEFVRKIGVGMREKEELLKEKEGLVENLSRVLGIFHSIKEFLIRVDEDLSEKELENGVDHGCEGRKEEVLNFVGKSKECKEVENFWGELDFVSRMAKKVEEKLSNYREKEDLLREMEAYRRRNKELVECLLRGVEVLGLTKETLMRVSEGLDENKVEIGVDHERKGTKEETSDFKEKSEELQEVRFFSMSLECVSKMAKRVEDKFNSYQEKVKKEKRELESSVVSLTEENRDVNALLRIALIEKETVEKSLNKLKGNNHDQRRVPLLQFAERSLQKVGFGFIMGENTTSNDSNVADVSSECEEVVSLASTVEKMMKNLRLEITQLRRALEESRSDTERLQSFTEKQTQKITEQTIYIKELEDRERTLSQNVEELLIEVKATEEDVQRWREACELEVEAGKRIVQERDNVAAILKQELEKTRAALQVLNNKLKLKEELAVAAMAAESAAERSLKLADSRAVGLCERIEELMRQLEEAESKERKSSRICWPWQPLKLVSPANASATATTRV